MEQNAGLDWNNFGCHLDWNDFRRNQLINNWISIGLNVRTIYSYL